MSSKATKLPFPLFDTAANTLLDYRLPVLPIKADYLEKDYKCAHIFLYAYKENIATFNAYRRDVQRLLLWSWLIHQKSILELRRADIELYLKFCTTPPLSWIGIKKAPHFINMNGERKAHPEWRPFVKTISKMAAKNGEKPDIDDYSVSEKAIREIFTILSSFYNFLIREELTDINPILQIRQKSRYIRKQQSKSKIRRLSPLQWDFVIETALSLADSDPRYERTLFIMVALYSLYLRVSELTATPRWTPKMCDFWCDQDNNWWFTTVGKGNKERQITVSDSMLEALKRWRNHLGVSPLPSSIDVSPLIPKDRGTGAITSTNQIRNIVQYCFDQTVARMVENGFGEEAENLRIATVHWLRHTGISDDVKSRPREHVRDDAGHSSSAVTDKYIDIELRERHASGKRKQLTN